MKLFLTALFAITIIGSGSIWYIDARYDELAAAIAPLQTVNYDNGLSIIETQ
jgi:hypothetical protein